MMRRTARPDCRRRYVAEETAARRRARVRMHQVVYGRTERRREGVADVVERGRGLAGRSVAARSFFTSSSVKSLQRPGFNIASRIGPMATRVKWVTGWPMASHIFR